MSQAINERLTDNSRIPKEFIRRQGNRLVVGIGDYPIQLQGICFGNQIWGNPSTPPVMHHNEDDYRRVRDMHMNVIRFYLNYGLFESDSEPYDYKSTGWAWLDQNIQWAKRYGIYLILNMHYPQGGYQSMGDGLALWDIPENQNRLISLWKAIADRYKDEPIIAGFDLVNEPVVSSSLSQWQDLANQLVSNIRAVDRNHLIIVERMNGVKGNWPTYNELNFFLIDDSNLTYTFHFYTPIEYSHQNTPWSGVPEDGGYPDASILYPPPDIWWADATFNNPLVPAGDTDWQLYTGEIYNVVRPELIAGKPAFQCENNAGTVYFDDFVIKEYDENRDYLRDLYAVNITSMDGGFFWSENDSGSCALSMIEGHGDGISIHIAGTTDDANISFDKYRFLPIQGHHYQINGYIKGVDVSPDATCRMRIDFEYSPSGLRVYPRNKDYLDSVLTRYLAWGAENNVPMYVGEFGLYKDCFASDKGGVTWVSDMIDLLSFHGVHFTYHAYHESSFGIYQNDIGLPDASSVNAALIDLFTEKLPFNTLAISKIGTGYGRISSLPLGIDCGSTCSATYIPGTSVTLTSIADSGSIFGGWSGACSGKGPCSLTLDGDKSITGTFSKLGDVNGDGNVDFIDVILTLKATAGILSDLPYTVDADVDDDGNIGLSEVIYMLQKMAGLR